MKSYEIEQRIKDETEYILASKGTIRQCANHFKASKSTVHKDLSERLPRINLSKYNEVKELLDTNWEEKYIRGGLATKRKYERMQ